MAGASTTPAIARPNYDAGLFVESWDDENARKGYCLYKMGCKGPVTYNSLLGDGVERRRRVADQESPDTVALAATNLAFWDGGPFYQHLSRFPGFGIELPPDTIGTAVGLTTLAGVAAHAIVTNVRKKPVIDEGRTEDQTRRSKGIVKNHAPNCC